MPSIITYRFVLPTSLSPATFQIHLINANMCHIIGYSVSIKLTIKHVKAVGTNQRTIAIVSTIVALISTSTTAQTLSNNEISSILRHYSQANRVRRSYLSTSINHLGPTYNLSRLQRLRVGRWQPTSAL